MNYEPVIGLEVHVELNTKSKMFCRCSADYFGKKPNTHTCPVCLGLPGALPYINEEAIKKCIQIGLALNCKVAELSRFERKNYFYPDLPKGYQISQYRWPLCINGEIEVEDKDSNVSKIRINRVHQEEDTAKLAHTDGQTLIDFNRSSVPLVEIVTEPDFHDSDCVVDYAKKLQQIFRYLGVSNADMEKGDMRLEANVSVRLQGEEGLPNYRVELKNINSFRFMKAAIEYEIKRQIEALEKGEKLVQETRGWNEDKRQTYVQRSKEEAHDYRYFPDPDLLELRIKNLESRIKEEMPELPLDKIKRFMMDYGVSRQNAQILTESKDLADYFEEAVKLGKEKQIKSQEIANFIVNQKVKLASQVDVLRALEFLAFKRAGMIEDEEEIAKIVDEVLKENPGLVEAYKKGKVTVIQALIGGVMKKTGGKVNVEKARNILESKLQS
ncbi:MAG: Asp-tRNA(Asn)/Glu-tRNA(Gln) amidotransferase subunit GatB [Patescibacteria group bacterium]|nr:Asp-tRNA(Asn)/Glu-tRNA(Gln) amidotransferase subunit GatB [Patescibacteria group bacterium]